MVISKLEKTMEKDTGRKYGRKEGWAPKNWRFWIESPLETKIKPVNPNGNQPWIFTGRTDAETPTLCQPDVKSQLTGKDPHAGKDCEQEKGATEDKMIGWHYWLNGHEFEWTLEDSDGQGSLECSGRWGRKESDTT